jgi:2-hydroxy-4-carboxymuconate semialdehyde hemiacetal dehydrogenase
MPDVGLCVIGGGGAIAQRHMQAFQQLGGVAPRWVVSDDESRALAFAQQWSFARSGTSVEQALSDPLVDLVLVASPSPLHSNQAVQAMQAGKDVMVEIPVAMSGTETHQVVQVAAATRRRCWVCHTMRSRAALRYVRDQVTSGNLHITQISGYAGIPRRRNQGMDNVGTRTWIDNLLWHHGCHQVDTSLWVLGAAEVAQVQALLGPRHPTLGMTLDAGIQVSLGDGTLVTHSLTYNVDRAVWRLHFIGHEDVLTYEDGQLTNEAGTVLCPGEPAVDCMIQNGEILRARDLGGECEYDLPRMLLTMEVLARAQLSVDLASGK